ncbi:MAG: phospho-sugar mutase [Candidatus Nanogingivalis sp.]
MNEARKNLSKSAFENLQKWLSESKFLEFREEIFEMIDNRNWQELEDAFFKVLEFGTAGRRGKVGTGSNRINEITIGESVQALAEYLKSEFSEEKLSVAIAWDVRNSSEKLARFSAEVLAKNDIKVYFFDGFRSTPELSFAVRELGANAGIVISASHNPPEDNGIKIYWNDGAQISSPHDKNLMKIAQNVSKIERVDFEIALKSGKIEIIGADLDEKYLLANAENSVSSARDIKIVFSPIHGTGTTNLLLTLRRAGFGEISIVKEQFAADGNFSSVKNRKPNPENFIANEMAISQLRREKADIALTTDPDADRICVISREKNGSIRIFSGNETAILVADFLLAKSVARDDFSKIFIAKSFVTTDALNALAKKYGAKIYDDFLVGFKFIGRKIREKQESGEIFLAGFEESLGGLVGSQARDKDAATIGLAICELASELKLQGKTLGEKLEEIYTEIGFFVEKTDSLEFSGKLGFEKMCEIMRDLRDGKIEVGASAMNDFLNLKRKNLKTGEISKIEIMEAGDALSFEFGRKGRRISIRPSGTEPKMKIYAQWLFERAEDRAEIGRILEEFKERIL